MELLKETINSILPVDREAEQRARWRWDSIAKPLHSLGLLEDAVAKMAGIVTTEDIKLETYALLIACADNGVVKEGVTQTGSEVTAAVAANFVRRKTSVCMMAKEAGVDIFPYDFGMLTEVEGVKALKIARGTKNFAHAPAMDRKSAVVAIENGICAAAQILDQGYGLLALGEMGIGNTTTSSAVAASLLDVPVDIVTGRGSGLSDEGLQKKKDVIQKALFFQKPNKEDPIDVLSKVGGYDIAALCGSILLCASRRVPVLLDGLITSVAALCACRMCPLCRDYLLASHISKEPAGGLLLDALNLKPFLTCEMCLGEGTGAVAAVPLLKMALSVYQASSTFGDISIDPYQPY